MSSQPYPPDDEAQAEGQRHQTCQGQWVPEGINRVEAAYDENEDEQQRS